MTIASKASGQVGAQLSEDGERAFMSGVQALARVVMDRMLCDRRSGRRTASFVCGYPGSPLGGFDRELQRMRDQLAELDIVHQPGLNEELAATAVNGSQLAPSLNAARFEGVVGYWYGKSPGLDRAADALRHANFAGTSSMGGALALVGDDPANKSSTLPSSSLGLLADLGMPTFTPGDVGKIRTAGFHAVELSRISGLWVSLRLVSAVADGTGIATPSGPIVASVPEGVGDVTEGRVVRGLMVAPSSNEAEEMLERKLAVARDYVTLNQLNQVIGGGGGGDWLALVSYGHTTRVMTQALEQLGIPLSRLSSLGIRLIDLAVPWPLDRGEIRRLCAGVQTVAVVEEKRPFVEAGIKEALYGVANPPAVIGKTDAEGSFLLPQSGTLDIESIGDVVRSLLGDKIELPSPPKRRQRIVVPLVSQVPERTPFFCPGCPHTTGLQVPAGELVGAGIGCHGMARLLPASRVGEVISNTQMGGEGAQWIGMAPFTDTPHFTQNLGDGTLFHSGYLAIRFAVATGANMTYKILYNSTVAMTGGQKPVGGGDLASLCTGLLAEGVRRVAVTTDDVRSYRRARMPRSVRVVDRSEIVHVQEEFVRSPGVSVVIHAQECAAERRRKWKTDPATTPSEKVVINQRICEGCGDCSAKAACVALEATTTEFGVKTRINQAGCALDLSCIQGDCPSFARVVPRSGRVGRKQPVSVAVAPPMSLPDPECVVSGEYVVLRMAGVGGTGVVTVSQIVGTAAKRDGLFVIGADQTGLSQKSGPVVSDIRFSKIKAPPVASPGVGEADVVMVMDALSASRSETLSRLSTERTRVVGTLSVTTPGSALFQGQTALIDVERLRREIDSRCLPGESTWLDAGAVSERLLGRRTAANVLLLGVAFQRGLLPITADSIEAAIRINGVAVDENLAAFAFGRQLVEDPDKIKTARESDVARAHLPADLKSELGALCVSEQLQGFLDNRCRDLIGYQGARHARRYVKLVGRVLHAERACGNSSETLAKTVAFQFHRLLAYKDEYEVARQLLLPEAQEEVERVGGPGAHAVWMLHPPLLRALGRRKKVSMGAWSRPAMRGLRHGKHLRGTPLDPFGRTEVRAAERRLIQHYESLCAAVCDHLAVIGVPRALDIVGLVDRVRGYENVKLRNLAAYENELRAMLRQSDIDDPGLTFTNV